MLLVALVGCSDYNLGHGMDPDDVGGDTDTTPVFPTDDIECTTIDLAPEQVGLTDSCTFEIGGFNPVVDWEGEPGKSSLALPVVADLDQDGHPEIVANITSGLFNWVGTLAVYAGDGSGKKWERADHLGYASAPAVGDIDGDGHPDIVEVKEYANSMLAVGDYTAVAYDAEGNREWESAHYKGLDFDYATAPILADLDHDGFVEVVVGRVILNGADGTTRGVGEYGRGSYGVTTLGGFTVSESSVPAVADLDQDGVDEVIVGNAMYSPDGEALWHDPGQDDGMIGIANLDDDPDGEFVASSYNTVRAVDTDGSVIWGPMEIPTANIVSPPAIDDVDGDGKPEIVVAGGNNLYCLHADGTIAWQAAITDMSGATGASFFDFEGDGIPEVVYVDEVEIIAFDGPTGAIKFITHDHASNTMMDYPVIADVDADGHADMVVSHFGYSSAFSVYRDQNDSWAPARLLWNQHAYSIDNINDDLTVPADAVQAFTTHNSWHSAMDRDASELVDDLEGEIAGICDDDCDQGTLHVVGRLRNRSARDLPAGIPITLYARIDGELEWIETKATTVVTPGGWTGEPIEFDVPAEEVAGAEALLLRADDSGSGGGVIAECSEINNEFQVDGPFCQ